MSPCVDLHYTIYNPRDGGRGLYDPPPVSWTCNLGLQPVWRSQTYRRLISIKVLKSNIARENLLDYQLKLSCYYMKNIGFSFTTILRIFIIIVHFRTFRIDLYAYNIFFELIFQYSLKVYRAMEKGRKRGQHKAPLKIVAVLWMVYIHICFC